MLDGLKQQYTGFGWISDKDSVHNIVWDPDPVDDFMYSRSGL